MQNALSATRKNTGKKLDSLSATIPTGVLGIFLDVNRHLASWLAREVSKLCLGSEKLIPDCHSRGKTSFHHVIEIQHCGPVVPLPSLALFSRAEHYTPSISSRTSLFAAVIDAELRTDQ